MEGRVIPIQDWLDTFRGAADDFARGSLRFDGKAGAGHDNGDRPGAYIAILSDSESVHLGLCMSPHDGHVLARALLGLGSHDTLSEKDMVDGVSEVMNIVAGKVKSHMAGRGEGLRLGLPMFIPRPITPAGDMETASVELSLGPVICRLTVYRRGLAGRTAA
ncbi:MAG: chemotaxis protein CheX [Candidatus Eisenbacteria bacterium]